MPVHSPLAISNIIFSQCERPDEPMTLDATPKLSFYRNVLQPNAVPILLRIRRRRVFLGSLSCVAIIVALTYVFSRGVTLGHVKISSSKSHQAALVQDYNSYLATLVAIVTKPLEVVIAMVVPVATWCFATESVMGTKHSWRTRSLIWMTNAVLLWLLSNAFYGFNVQLIDETQVLSAVGLADPTIPAVESQTGSAVNSLLRSATQSQAYRVARSNCTLSSPKRLSGAIEYGFPSRDWMKTVVVDTKSFVNSSRVRLSSVPSDWSSTLPMPVTSAGEVITLAYPLLHELLRHPLDQPFNGTVASDNILESLTKTHAALESFVNTTSSKSLEWIDISSAEVEFTRKEASLGNLVFDSVTIELPFQAEYMQRQLTLSENKTTTNITYEHHAFSDNGEIDYFFDINVKEECGEAGCVVSPRGEGQTMAIVDMGVQVRALALCVDEESSEEDLKKTIEVAISQDGATQTCARLSSTSFAVVSLAQRVEGDQMDKADGVIRLKNARKFYSISIARVSWSHKDISSMLGEACSTQAECMGLSTPLSSTSDLVVGHKAIAMEDLRVLRSGGEHWPYLVATSSQEVDSSGNLKGDMIFPSNFKFESESLDLKDQECESERGRLLQSIKVNHWFSTHSLDSAFLSAVLWLFQNGVVIESESSSSVASSTDPTPEISARLVVRVPPKSALYTYAGCSILVLLSVCVLLFSKQTEAQIEKHFRPVHLAQMLVDTSSELCPSTRLVQSDLLNVGGDLLSSSESLTEFEIVSLTLRHRTITTTMIQVPKGPSVSVS